MPPILVGAGKASWSDSGYVPTSQSLERATGYAGGVRGQDGPVYEVQSGRGVDVNTTLGADSPYPGDLESAMPGGIYGNEIRGFYTKADGALTGDFTSNPYFGLNGTAFGAMGIGSSVGSYTTPLGKKGH